MMRTYGAILLFTILILMPLLTAGAYAQDDKITDFGFFDIILDFFKNLFGRGTVGTEVVDCTQYDIRADCEEHDQCDWINGCYYASIDIGQRDIYGQLDTVNCQEITGWMVDTQFRSQSNSYDLLVDGVVHSVYNTGIDRQEICDRFGDSYQTIGGFCNHGFSLQVPDDIKDGNQHQISIIAHPIVGQNRDFSVYDPDTDTILIQQTITCISEQEEERVEQTCEEYCQDQGLEYHSCPFNRIVVADNVERGKSYNAGDQTCNYNYNTPYPDLNILRKDPDSLFNPYCNNPGLFCICGSKERCPSADECTPEGCTVQEINLTRDANFISQDVPATLLPGETTIVNVTMENTGTESWTEDSQIRLGSYLDNLDFGIGRIHLDPEEIIQPGEKRTFTFNITAPVRKGTYKFHWQMVKEGIEWFGFDSPRIFITVAEEEQLPEYDAVFVSQDAPTIMMAGETTPVTITMKNTGTSSWTGGNITLVYRTVSDPTAWGITFIPLSQGETIAPDEYKSFTFTITAPDSQNTYQFEWQLKQDENLFGEITPRIPVIVSLSKCSDGTLAESCSTELPLYCEDGGLISKCSECGCLENYQCNVDTELCEAEPSLVSTTCSDGTLAESCSTELPLYCEDGGLISKCSECGCSDNLQCNLELETCVSPITEEADIGLPVESDHFIISAVSNVNARQHGDNGIIVEWTIDVDNLYQILEEVPPNPNVGEGGETTPVQEDACSINTERQPCLNDGCDWTGDACVSVTGFTVAPISGQTTGQASLGVTGGVIQQDKEFYENLIPEGDEYYFIIDRKEGSLPYIGEGGQSGVSPVYTFGNTDAIGRTQLGVCRNNLCRFVDENAESGKTYTYRVQAYYHNGESDSYSTSEFIESPPATVIQCQDECSVEGESICNGISKSSCGQFDEDSCLDLITDSCPSGTACISGSCKELEICKTIVDSGSPNDKLDIVIVPDKFSQEQLYGPLKGEVDQYRVYNPRASFVDLAEIYSKKLLSIEPFKSNADKINIHRIDSVRDLDCRGGAHGIKRGVQCDFSEVRRLAGLCPYDYISVLINTDEDLGSANGRGKGSIATSSVQRWSPAYYEEDGIDIIDGGVNYFNSGKYTFVHELGHTLGKLNDEYVYEGKDLAMLPGRTPPPNCDSSSSCPRWANLKDIRNVGCFKGCTSADWYRPIEHCSMMLDNCGDFNPVDEQQIGKILEGYR